jgi:serine/threonine-protein kinase RsbW
VDAAVDSLRIFGNSGPSRGVARPGQGSTLGERIAAEIDNDITEIARVTSMIESFGERHRLPQSIVFHLTLAFDELLTNIILHGFPEGGRHKINASLGLDGDSLVAEIVDGGIAFDPLAKATPDVTQSAEERDVGGLGIHFIRSVMDRVDYRRSGGRNHVTMVKKVPAEPAD